MSTNTSTTNNKFKKSPSARDLVKLLKQQVFELEKSNYDKLYIYRTSKDWWRMGGNSALFFHYEIAIQLNTHSTLRLDNDYYSTWQTGVVALRQLDPLLEKFKKAGFPYTQKGNTLVTVQLPHKFTNDDVSRFSQAEQAKAEQFNKIIIPNHIMPRINTRIDRLAERVVNTSLQLPRQRYDLYGSRCANPCIQLQKTFAAVSNNRISLDSFLTKSLLILDELSENLVVAKKYNLFDNSAALDCARHIEFLRENLPKEVKKMQKRLTEKPPKTKPTTQDHA